MAYRKLGRPSDQRKAILRTLTTALIWNGRIETTETRAKEVRSIAEKLITLAVKEHDNNVNVEKAGKTYINDAPTKLAARRTMMAYLYDVKEPKDKKESKSDYRARTKDVKHPVVEKLMRELGPQYAARAKDLGQGGGYTRIIKIGPRRGDAAPMAILELV
ncbi:50S ribosomal protein L17 [Eubacteriales bacterium OttesenSCG-928-M02]|nr:50S ribosomal protein L17 [Eubacteriales bacterium OttesenSCG-928-M02]